MFWGFSEALDLYEQYCKAQQPGAAPPTELNILLFGLGDPRHVLKSASRSFKHDTKLNFFLLEGCVELLARNLLLTSVAFESRELFSVKGKTHLFMDIFGNTLLRPFSNAYINAKAKVLTRMITDAEFAESAAPMFSFDKLKYRERDHLENVFYFWTNREQHVFNVAHYWDVRVRNMLGARYDNKMGTFDWDLHMRLRENGAKQICPQEYKHWRNTGIAFTFPEYEQSDPNKTLAVGLSRNGNSFMHRGIVGDISTGPYISFGNKCPEEKLTASKHGVNDFRSTDVTERNVYEIIYEIQEKRDYVLDVNDIHQYGSYVLDSGKNLNKEQIRSEPIEACKYDQPLVTADNIRIIFLPIDDVAKIQTKSEHFHKYDIVMIANNYFSFLKNDFSNILKNESLICFETRQLTTFHKDEISKFNVQIKDYAKACSLTPITNFDINVPHSIFRYRNNSHNQ
ncbi:dynein axonemal assembly factor 3 homolog [Wyeomyia smithii]|uniref:dynein axonemal assembly factor 3 homolog n=1 Tax=Wyeomyia smithii TaxID=174621 RepID=UPI00246800FC|nr:dynein axonemal assembly factor 3 homolog [Wyeomyia smithii]XP_055533030.1 dynein axonemal assembly factor 3 homolog [Wyeomyia smithii]